MHMLLHAGREKRTMVLDPKYLEAASLVIGTKYSLLTSALTTELTRRLFSPWRTRLFDIKPGFYCWCLECGVKTLHTMCIRSAPYV